MNTHVSELHCAGFAELRHGGVGRLRLDEELAQGHLLAAKHCPHGAALLCTDLWKTQKISMKKWKE